MVWGMGGGGCSRKGIRAIWCKWHGSGSTIGLWGRMGCGRSIGHGGGLISHWLLNQGLRHPFLIVGEAMLRAIMVSGSSGFMGLPQLALPDISIAIWAQASRILGLASIAYGSTSSNW